MWLHVSWVTLVQILTLASKLSPFAASKAQLILIQVPERDCMFPLGALISSSSTLTCASTSSY